MKSSYSLNSYNLVFEFFCKQLDPKLIVEIGILDGFSLKQFVQNTNDCKVDAYDLFDDYPYNRANKEQIKSLFPDPRISVIKQDFSTIYETYRDKSIDILHIDVSNDGDTYEFAFEKYLPKVRGIMLLEVGSEDRDEIDWMKKYNKKKICPVLTEYKMKGYKLLTLNPHPSLTIVTPHR